MRELGPVILMPPAYANHPMARLSGSLESRGSCLALMATAAAGGAAGTGA